jgi:hypothetical protein
MAEDIVARLTRKAGVESEPVRVAAFNSFMSTALGPAPPLGERRGLTLWSNRSPQPSPPWTRSDKPSPGHTLART